MVVICRFECRFLKKTAKEDIDIVRDDLLDVRNNLVIE